MTEKPRASGAFSCAKLNLKILLVIKPVNWYPANTGVIMADKKNLTIQIKEEEHRKLKALAAERGLTIKEAILNALDKMFPDWRKDK